MHEQREGTPRLAIEVFFSAHESTKDAAGLAEKISATDIFIPEMSGWTDDVRSLFRSVSDGEIDPQDVMEMFPTMNHFLAVELGALYGSKKKILFIDLPEGHPLEKTSPDPLIEHAPFKEQVRSLRELLEKDVEFHKKREDFMLSVLPERIEQLLEEYPELKAKSELKVLIQLGSSHTRFYHELKKGNKLNTTTRSHNTAPTLYSSTNEAFRRMTFRRDVSDNLLAHALLEQGIEEHLIDPRLWEKNIAYSKISEFVRKWAEPFTLGQISALFDSTTKEKNTLCKALEEEFMKKPGFLEELDALGKE